jgi:hypothetical protein
MGREIIWVFILAASCFGQLGDDEYLIVQSLIIYVKDEHRAIELNVSTKSDTFHWEFTPFARFPILQGKQCPYFSGEENYRDVEGLGSVVYKAGESIYYVGIEYYFEGKNYSEVDTSYYKVMAYCGVPTGWKRCYDVMTLKCHYGKVIQETGRVNY